MCHPAFPWLKGFEVKGINVIATYLTRVGGYFILEGRMSKDVFRRFLYQRLAWILPKELVYFVIIRALASVTTGKWSNTGVPKLTMVEALNRWEAQLNDSRKTNRGRAGTL